ncbi:NAD(P)H-dependent oxidoreductase [Paenalkalicoccus suaedae]|uniref:NAD(P)H-dependent oxidoreductase n=1 Tax=Paenalkalicoccus suaedae TaxID=2592382 RepID=A0A859FHZ2_9BACI|nr:NAD(P)H-dependent oxidoreductase [Paenalkalicoccus suaedae]QKS71806.1 NAD(P)H-dependent oxidoreductase [Paenalkalicoccus suaedae]
MSKYLIVYMHPSTDSFNGAILQTLQEELGETSNVRNLAEISFIPHLTKEEYELTQKGIYSSDVEREWAFIHEAEHILFVFPLWWGSFPAIGKGYLDRVLAFGKAYELDGEEPVPLMSNKKASLIFTTGTPKEDFMKEGLYEQVVHLIEQHIFTFCGLKLENVLHFGDVIQSSDSDRKKMLEDIVSFAKQLD